MVTQHYRWDFIGLSTDEKPTPATSEKVVDGSTFYCSDTSKLYVYCTDDWYERKPLGGGGGGGGSDCGIIQLTTDDYNYPVGNPDGVALWNLPIGRYSLNGVNVYIDTNTSVVYADGTQFVQEGEGVEGYIFNGVTITSVEPSGQAAGRIYENSAVLSYSQVTDTTGNSQSLVMSQYGVTTAINERVLQNAGAPTTSTVGTVGQLLEDTTNGKLYQCTSIDTTDPNNPVYTWTQFGGGGGGLTVVQTTGTSTTDVMSQNAVTSMVFADPATMNKIKIGAGTSSSEGNNGVEIGHNAGATGNNSIALGYEAKAESLNTVAIGQYSDAKQQSGTVVGNYAKSLGEGSVALGAEAVSGTTSNTKFATSLGGQANASQQGSVALGAYARTTNAGEVNIGTTKTSYGYNSSNYRLLSGVYDGQNTNDAVNVSQVNSVIDAINTALSTNIPHIGASV